MKMRMRRPGLAAVLVALACLLPACKSGAAEEQASGGELATVEPVEGTDVSTVTLSAEAAERIDVQTEAVRSAHGELEIPYDAVLYDPAGDTWAFTSPEALTFVRAPIDVDRIVGNRVLLSDGPPAGTDVVVVGAAELLGTEYEVGEE
jgi:hypothetical protein